MILGGTYIGSKEVQYIGRSNARGNRGQVEMRHFVSLNTWKETHE